MSEKVFGIEHEQNLYCNLKQLGPETKLINYVQLFRFRKPAYTIPGRIQSDLIEAFRQSTDRLYQADTSFHWHKHERYFDTVDTLWVCFSGFRLVGFAAISVFLVDSSRVIYIDNMNLRPMVRTVLSSYTLGSVLIHEMLISEFNFSGKPLLVAARTQSPRIYELAYMILPRSVYPHIVKKKSQLSSREVLLAEAIAAHISPGKDYDVQNSVIRHAYHSRVYGNIVERPDDAKISVIRKKIGTYWSAKMDLDAGDALLLIVFPTVWQVTISLAIYLWNCWLESLLRVRWLQHTSDA